MKNRNAAHVTALIAKNIKRLRKLKGMSQTQVSVESGVPQGQYSKIENSRVEPSVSTLEKLSRVFEVSIAEFFRPDDFEEELNLPLLQKIKMIDELDKDEQKALLKMIDMALANKRLKENLKNLITE
jgi:transcriptional regulator with XRE-family HTH domain